MASHNSGYAQTKMMSWTSGRTQPRTVHPGVTCDHCKEAIVERQVRYACMECEDFDLCGVCEASPTIRQAHFGGVHLFAKVRDSTLVDVDKYRKAMTEAKINDATY